LSAGSKTYLTITGRGKTGMRHLRIDSILRNQIPANKESGRPPIFGCGRYAKEEERIYSHKGKPFITYVFLIALIIVHSFLIADGAQAITINGSDTIAGNTSSQYTAANCAGPVSWSVSGTGASVNSSGLLSTAGSSCGTITLTATCLLDGATASREVRANSGSWVLVGKTTDANGANCYFLHYWGE